MSDIKVYFSGNSMIVQKASGDIVEAPKKDCKINRTASGVYDIMVGPENVTFKAVAFATILDESGVAYGSTGTFETLYRANCGEITNVVYTGTGAFGADITVVGDAQAATVTVTSATASTIASLNASKEVTSLATATYPSLTELAYVKGVTSAVQTQMDTKKAKIDSVSAQTGAYTLALADADKVVTFSKGTADTITIPLNAAVAFPTGTEIVIENIGVGTLTIAITATGTLQSKGAKVDIITFGVARLRKTATNTWILSGDLS